MVSVTYIEENIEEMPDISTKKSGKMLQF